MAEKTKIDLREQQASITNAKAIDDSLELGKGEELYEESEFNATSTEGVSADFVDHSWRFFITPPKPKTEESARPRATFNEAENLLREIDEILERDWNESELLEQSDSVAAKISSLLATKEKERDSEAVSQLSQLLAKLYKSVQKAFRGKNKEISTKYSLYASFWELRANLSKE